MADQQLMRFIRETTPHLNPEIVNGVATAHMAHIEAEVDMMFRSVAKSFPPGLEYIGGVPCTPEEEFSYLSRRMTDHGRKRDGEKQSAREYDISQSDTYMVKYGFRYQEKEIWKKISLPFVRDGGIFYLSGTRFVISPVLADQAISHSLNGIFVIFSRAKVQIERSVARFFMDGVLETVYQPHSRIHNKRPPKNTKLKVNIVTTLFHYLLCKYGFFETMLRFGKTNVKVIRKGDFSENDYPKENWVICRSAVISKPRTYTYPDYSPTDIIVLIPRREFERNEQLIKNMIGSFFYLADHFPTRISPDSVYSTRLWRVLLGLALWGDTLGEGALHDDVSDHIESLDEYVDERLRSELRPVGINISDIYEFFTVIIRDMSDWVIENRDKINSLYNKKLSVVYYMLYELLEQMNMFSFRITASANKRGLTVADVESHIKLIKTGFIYALLKTSGSISTTSSPNGNKALKLTVMMIPQSSSKKRKRKSTKKTENDPSRWLHASHVEVGGWCNITKSEPSALARINPFVRTNERGIILRDPQYKDLLDSCQDILKLTSHQLTSSENVFDDSDGELFGDD